VGYPAGSFFILQIWIQDMELLANLDIVNDFGILVKYWLSHINLKFLDKKTGL
jgi:hypothetical protein